MQQEYFQLHALDHAYSTLLRTQGKPSPMPEEHNEHRRSLAERISHWTRDEQVLHTDIAGLSLHNWDHPTDPTSYVMPASICLIGQGRKRLFLGERSYDYDAHHLLITSVDLPVVTQILQASPRAPYLGLTLEIDFHMVADLMLNLPEMPMATPKTQGRQGITVSQVSDPLLAAFNRLLDLMAAPADIHALAPLIKREIHYRLLTSVQGLRLRQIATAEHHDYRIARAIHWLGEHFNKPVRMEELAHRSGLSLSAFNAHFRAVTTLSPLQYQKKIRLNEARRLMLTERLDAASAAFKVGYESPSQFSREYSRHFGAPPKRDIAALLPQSMS